MKLIIVDDEEKVRKGMLHFIQMKQFPLSDIFTARDGNEALEIIQHCRPDIIITDVVMPGMSGIEFAQKAINILGRVKIIMVSGHSDLQYLKSAFQFEAVDYILKPIDLNEFETVLNKTIEACIKEEREQKQNKKLREKLDESMPYLRDKFFCDLVDGKAVISGDLHEKMEFFGVNIPLTKKFISINLSLGDIRQKKIHTRDRYGEQIKIIAIFEMVKQVFSAYFASISCIKEELLISVLLFVGAGDINELRNEIEEVCSNLCNQVYFDFGVSISVGVGNIVDSPDEIPVSYNQALDAINQSFFFGGEQVFFYSDTHPEENKSFKFSANLKNEVSESIYKNDLESLFNIIHRDFAVFYKSNAATFEMVLDLKLTIATLLIDLIKSLLLDDAKQFIYKDLINELLDLKTLHDIEQWMHVKLKDISSSFQGNRKRRSIKIVEEVKKIVEENAHTGINVQGVAYKVDISPNYLSAIFKDETGISLTEYITGVRLGRAADMLINSSLKIGEIASTVGFNDQNYFTKIFKKQFAVNPTEYRVIK